MIIVGLNGGLGNQLFQYAAGKSLSLHHNVPLWIDTSSFDRITLPDLEISRDYELINFPAIDDKVVKAGEVKEVIDIIRNKNVLQKTLPRHKRKVYTEPFFHFDVNFFSSGKDVYLKGGWQSEKYFSSYKEVIRKKLGLIPDKIKHVENFNRSLVQKQTVSVHIRRGDFLRKQIIFEWHGVMPVEYYQQAFEILKTRLGDFEVLYFTDDIEWVKEHLQPLKPGMIVSENISSTHYEDLYLMSQCKHNIIANSSFSWWGAWLNNNPDKIVIGPKKWFDQGPKDTYDIFPEAWVQI